LCQYPQLLLVEVGPDDGATLDGDESITDLEFIALRQRLDDAGRGEPARLGVELVEGDAEPPVLADQSRDRGVGGNSTVTDFS